MFSYDLCIIWAYSFDFLKILAISYLKNIHNENIHNFDYLSLNYWKTDVSVKNMYI